MKYPPKEELWNSISHLLGVVFAITATVLMVVYAAENAGTLEVVSTAIFGAGMIILYSASTLYHWFTEPSLKKKLRVFDHISIYILIAATYTPICLIGLQGAWGWSIFGVVWGITFLGILFKLSPIKNEKMSLILYLLMGWLIVIAAKPFLERINNDTILFIILGGLSYTMGVYFYIKDKRPYHHAIWHLFVLGGTVLHFIAIYLFLL